MLRVLVYENVSVRRDLVHKEVSHTMVRSEVTLQLEAVADYLNSGYKSPI